MANRFFTDQTITVRATLGRDITGHTSPIIESKDPDGTVTINVAVVEAIPTGIIFYVITPALNTVKGLWYHQPTILEPGGEKLRGDLGEMPVEGQVSLQPD